MAECAFMDSDRLLDDDDFLVDSEGNPLLWRSVSPLRGVCVGQHSVCLVRAAELGSGCSAKSGQDRAIVTAGIISATASPTIQPAEFFYAPTANGETAWTFVSRARITGWTLTGELTYFDHEAMSLLFGGQLVVGGVGTSFEGDNIGWASPWEATPPSPPLYLEFITKAATADGSTGGPAAVGHIFGRTILEPGDRTFAFEAATMKFTGTATPGGGMQFGPWADWPGADPIPASPYVQVSYSADEYASIVDSATCGLTSVPSIELLQSDVGEDLLTDDGQQIYVPVWP